MKFQMGAIQRGPPSKNQKGIGFACDFSTALHDARPNSCRESADGATFAVKNFGQYATGQIESHPA